MTSTMISGLEAPPVLSIKPQWRRRYSVGPRGGMQVDKGFVAQVAAVIGNRPDISTDVQQQVSVRMSCLVPVGMSACTPPSYLP